MFKFKCAALATTLFLLISLNFWSGLFAQSPNRTTLTGQLLDEKKIPLSFATIILKNASDSLLVASLLSDVEGKFKFIVPKEGQYVLEAKMLGFETLERAVVITSDKPLIELGLLSLNPSTKMLNAVNITAWNTLIERRADKIIVNLNNALAAGNSIMELMNKLPGVQVNPDDQINLNGRSVQIYIDGKATPLSSEALSSLLKGMPSENIQKIELIAHPSSKYDAAGGGGIINIVRKRNHKEGINGNLYGGLGQGHFGKHNGGINLNFKNTTYNLFFNMDYSYNHYFIDNDITTNFLNTDFTLKNSSQSSINSDRTNRVYTPTIGLDLYLSKKTTISFSANEGFQLFNKDATSITNNRNAQNVVISNEGFVNLVKTNSRNLSPGIHLQHQIDTLGKEFSMDVDYYNYSNNSDQNNVNNLYNYQGDFLNTNLSLYNLDRNFKIYSAKADYIQPLKNGGNLEGGIKSSYVISNNSNIFYDIVGSTQVLDPSQNDFFRYKENINAAYLNFSQVKKRYSYQVGLRAENTLGKGEQRAISQTFDKKYFQLFPSGYFDFKLTEKQSLNLSINRNINRPTYENLNPLIRIINSNTYQQGSPELRPALAYNSSLTYSLNNSFYTVLNYGITFHDLTYYTFAYNNSSAINTTRPVNNKYSQNYSVIVSYNKQVNPFWFTSTNVNFNRQSFKSTDANGGVYDPGLTAVNFDSYDTFNITKRFSFLFLLRYRSKSETANVISRPYFTFTTGVRQLIFGTRGSISCNVTDVFHTFKNSYLQSSQFVTQDWNNLYESRVVRISFNYSFGGKIKKTKTSNGAADEKKRTDVKES